MFWYACYSNAAFLISTASEKKKKTMAINESWKDQSVPYVLCCVFQKSVTVSRFNSLGARGCWFYSLQPSSHLNNV